ncbi:hypothetical protein IAT38_000719 [Cryptococcus sp. DSM 104549]
MPSSNVRAIELVVFAITFALAVTTVGAVGSSLSKRNNEIGEATKLAATRNVKLIVATNGLTQPGYALCAAAGGVVVNTLTLLILSFKMPKIARKLLWIVPAYAVFDALFMIATCIAVMYRAKTGHVTMYGTIGGIVLPVSTLKQQAAALGLVDSFWEKGYVKFMSIISIPTTVFAIATAVLAIGWYRRQQRVASQPTQRGGFDTTYNNNSDAPIDEKTRTEHV